MKFRISRTSCYRDGIAPCKEAFEDTYTSVDRRTFKTFEDYEKTCNHKFTEAGENHRVISGGIARDFPNQKCWSVEIDSLESLVAFSAKYGNLVIDEDEIEIYDTYRE